MCQQQPMNGKRTMVYNTLPWPAKILTPLKMSGEL
jgi:hypothetical protein